MQRMKVCQFSIIHAGLLLEYFWPVWMLDIGYQGIRVCTRMFTQYSFGAKCGAHAHMAEAHGFGAKHEYMQMAEAHEL